MQGYLETRHRFLKVGFQERTIAGAKYTLVKIRIMKIHNKHVAVFP